MGVGGGVGAPSLQDVSLRLVEYLETLRRQGVEKVAVYLYSVHPNMQKVWWFFCRALLPGGKKSK